MLRTAALTLALCLPHMAHADARQDAIFIAEATITHEIYGAAMSLMAPVMGDAMATQFRQAGIEVSDMDGFVTVITDVMAALFVKRMREEFVPVLLDLYSETELADIADFYATDSGVALIGNTSAMMQAGQSIGARLGQEIAVQAMPRIAARLESENIVITRDPDMMRRLIDLLKN